MVEAAVLSSITGIGRQAWDALFRREAESYDYLLAVEEAAIPGFVLGYVVAYDEGRIIAACPLFVTAYSLDTTGGSLVRTLVTAVRRVAPGFAVLKLACMGSPCTEAVTLGFAPDVADAHKPHLLRRLIVAFEQWSAEAGCGLTGVKDVAEADRALWEKAVFVAGYVQMLGLPLAWRAIDFPDLDGYLRGLSPATRKDLRRKLKARSRVQVQHSADISGEIDTIMRLYEETRARSDTAFEHLTRAYFLNLPARMPGKAFYVLYRSEGQLVGANLLIQDHGVLLDKFFLMDGRQGRDLNLYFLSWIHNLQHCIEDGLTRYHAGAAGYDAKLRLGSVLTPTHLYFRHRRRGLHWLLAKLAPLVAPDTGLAS